MRDTIKPVLDIRATLPEGPCWDERRKLLYWVDINEKKVHIYNPADNSDRFIETGQYTGAVVLRESGGAVVALHQGFYFLDLETGKLDPIDDPKDRLSDSRFNDGKCDAAGRFWAGTNSLAAAGPVNALYCLDTGLHISKHLGGVTNSNGIAWSPHNMTMYYIDTPTRMVMAYDFDLARGTLSNGRTVVRIPESDGKPDGMTSDTEGMLWIAHWGGWRVSRWDPRSGRLLDVIVLPVEKVSSCTFGGDEMDELYITTSRKNLDEAALEQQPYAGSIFRVKTGVKGLPSYRFRG